MTHYSKPVHEIKPTADQPGTIAQQFSAVAVYLDDPIRRRDRNAAWQRAREAAIPHASDAINEPADMTESAQRARQRDHANDDSPPPETKRPEKLEVIIEPAGGASRGN